MKLCKIWILIGCASFSCLLCSAQTQDKDAALLSAVERGEVAAARTLLQQGTHTAARNKAGRTLLIIAVGRGDLEMAKLLVQAGASVNDCTDTPTGSSVLAWAAEGNNLQVIELLLDHGADIDGTGRNSQSALFFAAGRNRLAMAKLLLRRGANPNKYTGRSTTRHLVTPMFAAVLEGQVEMMELLLAHGANLEKRSSVGATVLMCAAAGDKPEVLRWLIGKGAKINVQNQWGHTPLTWAVRNGQTENVKILLAAGTDVNVRVSQSDDPDYMGGAVRPEDLARRNGDPDLMRLLQSYQKRAVVRP